MRQIKAFETTDGRIFTDEIAAREHQGKIDFAEWYEKRELKVGEYETLCADDLLDWLRENREWINNFFNTENRYKNQPKEEGK